MKSIELTDEEKEFVKRLCSLQGKKEDLLIFFKDNFFEDRLLLVDDENEVVYYYFPSFADENAEILKLHRLLQIIESLKDEGYVTLVPYSHKNKKHPSIIWSRSTSNYNYNIDGSIQIIKSVRLGNGRVEENGKLIMVGKQMGNELYNTIQLLYSKMIINSSLNTFVDNGFKTKDEIKSFNEKTGSYFWKIIKGIKKLFSFL